MINRELVQTQVEKTTPIEAGDLYNAGKCDVVIGAELDPEWIKFSSYTQGYLDGYLEFYKEKYGIKVTPESKAQSFNNYFDGHFNGVIGDKPDPVKLKLSAAYRSGYFQGLMEFYTKETQNNRSRRS